MSIQKKYKGQTFTKSLRVYNRVMPKTVTILSNFNNCFALKYEDLLINPDKKLKEMFNFCGLESYDYETMLSRSTRVLYRKIDPSRAFAYKNLKRRFRANIEPVINIINDKVSGPVYEISEKKKTKKRTKKKRS